VATAVATVVADRLILLDESQQAHPLDQVALFLFLCLFSLLATDETVLFFLVPCCIMTGV